MVEELFKDGKVAAVGEYLDGERHGRWTFYFRNGKVKSEAGTARASSTAIASGTATAAGCCKKERSGRGAGWLLAALAPQRGVDGRGAVRAGTKSRRMDPIRRGRHRNHAPDLQSATRGPFGLAGAFDALFVPDGLGGLIDLAVGAEDQEAVKGAREPAVVGDGQDGALEVVDGPFQRLGRMQVQVVRGLVEEQQGGAGELQEQDLEPRLLAAGEGFVFLLRLRGQTVAVQRTGGGFTAEAGAVFIAPVQDFEQGFTQQVGPDVGLREEAGPDPGTEFYGTFVRDFGDVDVGHRQVLPFRVGAAGGEQSQEVALAGAVGAQHADAVAEPNLGGERLHQSGQFQFLCHYGALGGAAALEPHLHILFDRKRFRRSDLKELRQPRLCGVVPVGHVGAERGLVLVHVDEFLELHVLLVPTLAQFLEAGIPVCACVHVGAEAAAVDPGAGAVDARFKGDDPARCVIQQLAVVADEEDGLL